MRRKRLLAQIEKLLNEITLDTGQSTELNINFEAANEDAKKILRKAQAKIAEQETKKRTSGDAR